MESGKIALVTGGSRGLGRNRALALARGGHDVILTYKSRADEAAQVQEQVEAAGRRAAVLPLDAGEVASFPAFSRRLAGVLEAQWGRRDFDFLVNNAGFNGQGRLGDRRRTCSTRWPASTSRGSISSRSSCCRSSPTAVASCASRPG